MDPRVLIIGCGFAGPWAAQALRRAPVEITALDRTNHHLFTPLLYQVATAALSAPSIAGAIRHILADQRNTTVLLGDAQKVLVICPWQRGSNENTNGLLRQYFPKGKDLSDYSQAYLNKIALRLNQRPRKTWGYECPAD